MSSNIVIEDNYLQQDQFDRLRSFMMSDQIAWYYSGNYGGNYPLMEHWFHRENQGPERHPNTPFLNTQYEILNPLLMQLNPIAILKIRANCNWRTHNEEQRVFHTDITAESTTSILYINHSDGCTIFKDCDTIVESVANRFVTFPSNMLHAARPFTTPERRVLINFNYIARKQEAHHNVIKTGY